MAAAATATAGGQASIKGSSEAVQMVLLTFCTIGITFTWGIEMTYCTPYLLNLGLTKSNTSLVWVAGPLSGLIVQPIVGVLSDESTSRWGRRRPLMAVGAVVVAASLLVLGFTKELVGVFVGGDGDRARQPTIVLAVLAIYVIDFAINAIMSCSRSLVVDTLPIEKQQTGAAWGSRMNAIGHIIGYGAGAIDLVRLFGTSLGDTQFKQLTVIASFAILASTATTCWAVSERVISPAMRHNSSRSSSIGRLLKIFRQIYSTLLNLPPRIQAICWAQFWSWIGWFPFLFYSTTWVGETYLRYDVPPEARKASSSSSASDADALGDMGRIGSTALVIYSCVTFTGAFLLPLLVRSPDDGAYTHRPPRAVAGILERFSKMKPDLLTAWICGHLMFSAAMSMAPLARSFVSATVLVCLCGFSWAISLWAPTTFLGIEVNKLSGPSSYRRLSNQYHELSTLDTENNIGSSNSGNSSNSHNNTLSSPGAASASSSSAEQLSGIYFGILNIYTTLPQFIGTFIATIVFAVLEPGKSAELAADAKTGSSSSSSSSSNAGNAIPVCLFIGAMCTLVAAFMTRRLRDM